MVENKTPEEMFNEFPWRVQSSLIFTGAYPESYEDKDSHLIRAVIAQLSRNQPSLLTKCNEYLDTL